MSYEDRKMSGFMMQTVKVVDDKGRQNIEWMSDADRKTSGCLMLKVKWVHVAYTKRTRSRNQCRQKINRCLSQTKKGVDVLLYTANLRSWSQMLKEYGVEGRCRQKKLVDVWYWLNIKGTDVSCLKIKEWMSDADKKHQGCDADRIVKGVNVNR